MTRTPEQLDELINRVQKHDGFSNLNQTHDDSAAINLVSVLSNIPKARVEPANFSRVRTKILDRISLPNESTNYSSEFGASWLQKLPRIMRITGGVVGVFTIVMGLTIGTAAAALESLPGQPIYPLKRMVESVQMQLASSAEEKTNLQIKFANNRVDELATVLQKKREGKVSDEQVKKIVENTIKNLEQANHAVTSQPIDESKTELYSKILSLSDKQEAVIKAAQANADEEVQADLTKAWESNKITREVAIENIERAGLTIEDALLLPNGESDIENNEVIAEGPLTTASSTIISIGTSQFLLTSDTEYDNIKSVDLKPGVTVKIHGKVTNSKTYAVKIESVAIVEPTPSPTPEPTPTDIPQVQQPDNTDNVVPLNP